MGILKATSAALRDLRWVRQIKNLRNHIIDASFRKSGHDARDAFVASFSPRHDIVVFAIAFNTPWVIELLTAAWRKFVTDADLVVVDNSNSDEARAAHREICRARGIGYLPLPKNREWSANRSHGIAMNWIFYNLVESMRPAYFGFIDHDCFPTATVAFAELIGDKSVYGRKDFSAKTRALWSLWAGFCFFRYDLVAGKPLDFKHRPEFGMDTGGGNWWPVYSSLRSDQAGVADAAIVAQETESLVFKEQIIAGTFCHIGGASYRAALTKDGGPAAYRTYLWSKYLKDESGACITPDV